MPREDTTDEVKKLEALGFTPGETITWEAIEEVLTPLTRRDRRFRTVYRALIAHMRKWHQRKIVVKLGIGLYVLRDYERASDVVTTIGRTQPILQRATKDADDIPIVSLEGLHLVEAQHVRLVAHRYAEAAVKELAALATRPGMPEPTPAPPHRPIIGPGESRMVPKAS